MSCGQTAARHLGIHTNVHTNGTRIRIASNFALMASLSISSFRWAAPGLSSRVTCSFFVPKSSFSTFRPPHSPHIPKIPTCPASKCVCAPTPVFPDTHPIDHTTPLAGAVATYAAHLLVCTGADDWPSRIEDANDGDNAAAKLKRWYGPRGEFVIVSL